MRFPYRDTIRKTVDHAYTRITLDRLTCAFFVFSFIHCFAQGLIQAFLFSIDSESYSLVSSIIYASGVPRNLTYLEGTSGHLRLQMCADIPSPCIDTFVSSKDSNISLGTPVWEGLDGNIIVSTTVGSDLVTVTNSNGEAKTLSEQCTQNLVFPTELFWHFQREDLSFIFLQFWLFAISLMAIIKDSVPHTLAVLITRGTITAWSIYAIWRSNHYENILAELISAPGTPCAIDIFSSHFRTRIIYEIPDMVLNVTAFLIACYLSTSLLKRFNLQSFKCVGAPERIMRINKFFNAVLACLQLEVFVLVTAMALWIDVLFNTKISQVSSHTTVYEALIIFTTIFLIPWIIMGWYSIRREKRSVTIAFLVVGFVLISGWSIMFYSEVYRWTFLQWPFIGCFIVASLLLLIASVVLGVVCLVNFGKGLAEYLHAEEALASMDFRHEMFTHDEEKFPHDDEKDSKQDFVLTF